MRRRQPRCTQAKTLFPYTTLFRSQRFFLAYSALWAGHIRDEEKLRLTKIDPHSLGRLRVNATLKNIDKFYEAFGVKEGDDMFIPKEQRINIW